MEVQGEQKIHSRVVALAYDGFIAFEFAVVLELFGRRRPELEQIGQATKLTIYAATYEDDRDVV